jgi:UDP-glucose 4-epimerase
MRVLVTGASGYVGHAVLRALTGAGHGVLGLVHVAQPDPVDGVEWVRGDLLAPAGLRTAVADVDGVVHLAGLTRVRESFEQPERYYRLNVSGTVNLLECLGSGARMVFASTASVYGAPVGPIGEEAGFDPRNPYAATKVAAEQAIGWVARSGRIGAATLRIFNVSGAVAGRGDPDTSRILPRAVAVAAGRVSHVDIYGDGSAVRDFVHVADVASAFVRALEACAAGEHRVYNVGAVPASVAEVIAATERVTGRSVRVVHHDRHPGEVAEIRADVDRIRDELGWRPAHVSLDPMVADQWHSV